VLFIAISITFTPMHTIEPFYNWHHLYLAEEDEQSPYYGQQHSEFTFSNTIYNYYVHPQWDGFGSENLYLKILFVDYEDGYAIVEMIGEWNDAIQNDSMILKRNIIDVLIKQNIFRYVFITENVLNYHSGDVEYYEEWVEDIKDEGGYIVWLNLAPSSQHDFVRSKVRHYVQLREVLDWRTMRPNLLIDKIENLLLLG
jgi:hypothetical protein